MDSTVTEAQVVDSAITAVTVYRRGARITREAALPAFAEGTHRIRLEDLPLALSDGSVRVQVNPANGGAAPVASGARVSLGVPQREVPEHEVQTQLRAARQEERGLELQLEHIDRLLSVVQKIPVPSRPQGEEGKPPPPMSVEHRLSLITFGTSTQDALVGERAKIYEAHQQAKAQRLHLEQQWKWVSSQQKARPDEVRKALECELRCSGPCAAATLRAEYLVPGALWAPSYALRLSGDGADGVLGVRAAVRQDTGEDWSGAHVTFSTASPQTWAEVPELKALRIGRRQPPATKRGWRPPPQNTAELYADYDGAFSKPPGAVQAEPVNALGALEHEKEVLSELIEADAEGAYDDFDDEELSEDLDLFAADTPVPGGPPPPSAPMPASAAPPPPMAQAMSIEEMVTEPPVSRSRGLLSFGSSAPKGAMRREPMKKRAKTGVYPAIGGGGPLPPEEPEEVVGDDLLNYARLRISDVGSGRGKLRPIPERDLYREHLEAASGPRVEEDSLDVWGVVQGAVSRARASAPLPKGHTVPSDMEGFDYAYPAEGALVIPSDGSFHTVRLMEKTASPRSHYVIVPRETQDAFRMVDFENPLESPLLEGPIDVYVGDRYLLTGRLGRTPKDGKVSLGLGVEQALKVARNTRFEEDTAGIMGGTRELIHGISVELVNHTGKTAKVHVRERIPVKNKEDKDVEVRVTKVTPAWAEYRQEPAPLEGGHEWVVEVPPGEKTQLDAEYVIAIPSKHELRGGNRRES